MSVVEDVRQVLQDVLAPALREIRGQFTAIDKRLDSMDKRMDAMDNLMGKRLDVMEDGNRIRFEAIVQRLEQIQQSFAFDKRLSSLEEDKRRSA